MADENLTLIGFLRAMPKAEIHCHLLGTVRYATFVELAERSRAPLERAEIDGFYTRGEKPVGVLRVLRALRALDAHLITRPDDLYRITREYLEDASGHGVRYSEFFWNPTGSVRESRIPYGAAQAAIVAAMREAETDFAIVSRLIPSIDREADPEAAVEMVDWVHKVTPTGAWQMMIEHFGFGLDDLRGFMLNGLDGAWLPEEMRRRWRSEWAAEFDALRARLVGTVGGEETR